MSARVLSEATAAIGCEIPRGTIAKVEVGKRGLAMHELLVLSRALSVPPWMLLVDLASEELVELWPGRRLHPWEIVRWFRGDTIHLPRGAETPDDPSVMAFMRWTEFETFWDSVRADDEQWGMAYLDLERARTNLERTPADRRDIPEYQQAFEALQHIAQLVDRQRAQLDERIRELATKWSREIGLLGRRADALQFAFPPNVSRMILEAATGFGSEPITRPDEGDHGDR